ncbi:MAG: hypothetical protein L0H94_16655, partial [Nitrospira sp.]|nr:hypothetical protein [Nitrospira sp.]
MRTKRAWIVEATRRDSDESCGPIIGFSARKSRATFGAEAALVFAARHARQEMVAQLTLRQTKLRRGHEQRRGESPARHSLAVATVALERHDGFGGGFVTNRAARASACKRYLHRLSPLFFESFLEVQFQRASSFEQALE